MRAEHLSKACYLSRCDTNRMAHLAWRETQEFGNGYSSADGAGDAFYVPSNITSMSFPFIRGA